ncbi:MAG: ABC transporter permease [Ignavibacteriaceae bacterium]|jgi:phospholipid/cholesterol/gamma-HCH transport system permease protein|nr:ABC transporter permease [Ignavibacteriaceae bacterium]
MVQKISFALGKQALLSYGKSISVFSFVFEIIYEIKNFFLQRKITRLILIRQILFTGFEALGLITFVAIAVGGIIILEGSAILPDFGQSKLLYTILVIIILRELGGLLTAFIIIARSGTAIAAELGNMVVNQEVESLVSFGISPVLYLVVPRVLGVVLSMIALNIYFNVAALAGGWFMAYLFAPIPLLDFLNKLFSEISVNDIASSFIKSLLFGFVIAVVSSYQGLQVSFASTEVPQRTIKAVVLSLIWVILFDIIITAIMYLV